MKYLAGKVENCLVAPIKPYSKPALNFMAITSNNINVDTVSIKCGTGQKEKLALIYRLLVVWMLRTTLYKLYVVIE